MNLSPIKSFDYKVDVSSFKNKVIDVDNSLWTEEIKLNIIKLMWLGKKTELYKKFYDENFFRPIIDYLGGDDKLYNIFFSLLEKGTKILPHVDKNIKKTRRRIHIPIITNSRVLFFNNGHFLNMKEGHVYEIDNSRLHAVNNASDKDRIHLIIDCYE